MSFLAVDLGTSGVRAGAYDADGGEIASHAVRLTLHLRGERAELDPAQVIAAVEESLATVARSTAVLDDPPQALSFSVQGEAVVPIDQRGDALAWAPVSMDRRGLRAAAACGSVLGDSRYHEVTGQPLHPMFSVFKIAGSGDTWRRPGVRYACLDTYVMEALGADPATDMTMAARTGMYDVAGRRWSAEVIDAVNSEGHASISSEQLPDVVETGTVIGALDPIVAARCELPAGLPLVAGMHDQAASWFGAGGAVGGISTFALGSSDCLTFGTAGRPSGLDGTGLATYPVQGDTWATLAGTAAGGWALEWFAGIAGTTVETLFNDLGDDPSPVLVLPYLAGSGTLDNDPDARGVIHGLDLGATRQGIARALVEAAGFELAKILGALGERGLHPGSLVAVGGGAGNESALRARASAAGVPLASYAGHASLRGAAINAAIGVGAIEEPPTPTDIRPAAENLGDQAWFSERRRAYVNLYEATRNLTTARSEKETPS